MFCVPRWQGRPRLCLMFLLIHLGFSTISEEMGQQHFSSGGPFRQNTKVIQKHHFWRRLTKNHSKIQEASCKFQGTDLKTSHLRLKACKLLVMARYPRCSTLQGFSKSGVVTMWQKKYLSVFGCCFSLITSRNLVFEFTSSCPDGSIQIPRFFFWCLTFISQIYAIKSTSPKLFAFIAKSATSPRFGFLTSLFFPQPREFKTTQRSESVKPVEPLRECFGYCGVYRRWLKSNDREGCLGGFVNKTWCLRLDQFFQIDLMTPKNRLGIFGCRPKFEHGC